MDSPERSLIDDFLDSTYSFPKQIAKNASRNQQEYIGIEKDMIAYRSVIRSANRFLLDDDFVDMATRLAHCDVKKVLKYIPLATLPYETTWIEFNPRVKVAVNNEMAGNKNKVSDKVPAKLGLLLRRDPKRELCWTMEMVGPAFVKNGLEDLVLPHQGVYLFNAAPHPEPWLDTVGGYHPLYFTRADMNGFGEESKLLSDVELDPNSDAAVFNRGLRGVAWGYSRELPQQRQAMMGAIMEDAAHVPDILLNHGEVTLLRFYQRMLQWSMKIKDRKVFELGIKEYMGDVCEQQGIIRWVITILALLNETPTLNRLVQPRGGRVLKMSKHNYLDYHTVSLKFPRAKSVSYYESLLRKAEHAKHRAHMVREHWRTYPNTMSSQTCPLYHEWVYSEDLLHRTCRKCKCEGSRIKSHQRGDASLGWVRKDYQLIG